MRLQGTGTWRAFDLLMNRRCQPIGSRGSCAHSYLGLLRQVTMSTNDLTDDFFSIMASIKQDEKVLKEVCARGEERKISSPDNAKSVLGGLASYRFFGNFLRCPSYQVAASQLQRQGQVCLRVTVIVSAYEPPRPGRASPHVHSDIRQTCPALENHGALKQTSSEALIYRFGTPGQRLQTAISVLTPPADSMWSTCYKNGIGFVNT